MAGVLAGLPGWLTVERTWLQCRSTGPHSSKRRRRYAIRDTVHRAIVAVAVVSTGRDRRWYSDGGIGPLQGNRHPRNALPRQTLFSNSLRQIPDPGHVVILKASCRQPSHGDFVFASEATTFGPVATKATEVLPLLIPSVRRTTKADFKIPGTALRNIRGSARLRSS